jgi:hypothetical protein
MKNKRWNIVLRILVTPFVFAIVLIAALINTVKVCYRHVAYGSELIFYSDKFDYNTISDIYDELKEEKNSVRRADMSMETRHRTNLWNNNQPQED